LIPKVFDNQLMHHTKFQVVSTRANSKKFDQNYEQKSEKNFLLDLKQKVALGLDACSR